MAITLSAFPAAKAANVKQQFNITTSTLKLVLLSGLYTDSNLYEYLSDVTTGVLTSYTQTLSNVAIAQATKDAPTYLTADGPVTFSSVTESTNGIKGVLCYADTGNAATSRVLFRILDDTNPSPTLTAQDYVVTWNASGILKWE